MQQRPPHRAGYVARGVARLPANMCGLAPPRLAQINPISCPDMKYVRTGPGRLRTDTPSALTPIATAV